MRMTRSEVESWRALRRREGRHAASMFLLEGWRSIAEAADDSIVSIAVRADQQERPELVRLRSHGVPIKSISERDLDRISATEHSQGIVACARIPKHDVRDWTAAGGAVWLALDAVSDPGNLGTIIRTADWFAAAGVLLGRGCVDPFNEKVVRATAGSLLRVKLVPDVDLVETLAEMRKSGFEIAAAVLNGSVPISKWKPGKRCAVILGSEAHGVSAELRSLAQIAVTIPRPGHGESLNVAITAGILMAHTLLR